MVELGKGKGAIVKRAIVFVPFFVGYALAKFFRAP